METKSYFELNVHQRINVKFTANLFRRGFIGNNENIYIFIFSKYDKIASSVYGSIPLSLANGAYKNSQLSFTL